MGVLHGTGGLSATHAKRYYREQLAQGNAEDEPSLPPAVHAVTEAIDEALEQEARPEWVRADRPQAGVAPLEPPNLLPAGRSAETLTPGEAAALGELRELAARIQSCGVDLGGRPLLPGQASGPCLRVGEEALRLTSEGVLYERSAPNTRRRWWIPATPETLAAFSARIQVLYPDFDAQGKLLPPPVAPGSERALDQLLVRMESVPAPPASGVLEETGLSGFALQVEGGRELILQSHAALLVETPAEPSRANYGELEVRRLELEPAEVAAVLADAQHRGLAPVLREPDSPPPFVPGASTGLVLDSGQGQWTGKLASRLRLSLDEPIEAGAFENVVEGRSPDGARVLVRPARGEAPESRRAGFDYIFAPHKSVSIQALLGEDPRILEAHRRAVLTALVALERDAGSETRRRFDATGELLIARFDHGFSRALDPQLHTHAFVLNLTRRGRGYGPLNPLLIRQGIRHYEQLYSAQLASELRTLGYRVSIDPTTLVARLADVPETIARAFSSRSAKITETQAERMRSAGIEASAAGPRTRQQLRDRAVLSTRESKPGRIRWETLIPRWQQKCRQLGFDPLALTRQARELSRDLDPDRRGSIELSGRDPTEPLSARADDSALPPLDRADHIALPSGMGLRNRAVRAVEHPSFLEKVLRAIDSLARPPKTGQASLLVADTARGSIEIRDPERLAPTPAGREIVLAAITQPVTEALAPAHAQQIQADALTALASSHPGAFADEARQRPRPDRADTAAAASGEPPTEGPFRASPTRPTGGRSEGGRALPPIATESVAFAVARLAERNSVFSRSELQKTSLIRLLRVSPLRQDEAIRATTLAVDAAISRRLHGLLPHSKDHLTTQAARAAETDNYSLVSQLLARPQTIAPSAGRDLATLRRWYGEQQVTHPDREALKNLTDQQLLALGQAMRGVGSIAMLEAGPGAGKSRSLEALQALARGEGWTVRFFAPTRRAVESLAEYGVHAETVQEFIRRPLPKELSARELWIVDEIGQTGQEDWNRLARMALHAGAKVYAVGDRQQHQAVPAGSIPQQLSAFGVPIYRIQELNRQHAPDPTGKRAPADANALRVAAFATHQRPARALAELRTSTRTEVALVARRRELLGVLARRGVERTGEALAALSERGSGDAAKRREQLEQRLADYRTLARPETATRNLLVVRDAHVQREAIAALYLARPAEERDRSLVVFPTHAARDEFAAIVRELRVETLGELDPRNGQVSMLRLRDLSWTAADSGDISAYLRVQGKKASNPLFLHFPTGHGELRLRRNSYVEVRAADLEKAEVTLALADGRTVTVSVRELAGQVSALEMTKLTLVVGDRVQFRKTEKAEGINNGDLATLVAVRSDPKRAGEEVAVFELDRRRVNGKPVRVELSSQNLHTFDFGYSVTSHSAQSITKDEVLAAYHTESQSQVLSSANATVDLTRSKHHVAVVTDDPQKLADLFESPHLRPLALAARSGSGAPPAPIANGIVRDEARARIATEQLIAVLAAHARPLDAMNQETEGLSQLGYRAWTRFEQAADPERRLAAWTEVVEALGGQYRSVHRDRAADLRRLPSPVVAAYASWQMERSGVPARYLENAEATVGFAREVHRELGETVPPTLTRTEHQRRLLYGAINLENVEAAAVAGDLPRYVESVDTVRQMLALDIAVLDRPEESRKLLFARLDSLELRDTKLRAEWIAATLSPTATPHPEDLRHVRLERSLSQDDPPPLGPDSRPGGPDGPAGGNGSSGGTAPPHPGSGGRGAPPPGGDRAGLGEDAHEHRDLDRGSRQSHPATGAHRRPDPETGDGLRAARASRRGAAVALGAAGESRRRHSDDDRGAFETARAGPGRAQQGAPAPNTAAQGGQRAQAGDQDRPGTEQEVLGGVRGGGAADADPLDGRRVARGVVRGGELQEGPAGAPAGDRAGASALSRSPLTPFASSPSSGVASMKEPSPPSGRGPRLRAPRVYAPDAVDRLRRLLETAGFKPTGPAHQFQAFCPGHKDGAKSGRRSLSIGTGSEGMPLLHCYAGCSHERVLGALGVTYDTFKLDAPSTRVPAISSPGAPRPAERASAPWEPMTPWPDPYKLRHPTLGTPQRVWAIRDRYGNLFAYKARWDAGAPGNDTGTKQVRWFRGGWSLNRRETPESERLHASDAPLYRSEIAFDRDRTVFLVEGEKSADALAALGLQVYGTHSASNRPRERNLEFLRGAAVIVWPDKDEAGTRQAVAVAGALAAVARQVDLAKPPAWLPAKGDAADYVDRLSADGLDARAVRLRLQGDLELHRQPRVVAELSPPHETEETAQVRPKTEPPVPSGIPAGGSLAGRAERAAPPVDPTEDRFAVSSTLRSHDDPSTASRLKAPADLGGVPRPDAGGPAPAARGDGPDRRARPVAGHGLPAAVLLSPDGVALPLPGAPAYRGQEVGDDLSVGGHRRGLVPGIHFTQQRSLAEQYAAASGARPKEVVELEVSVVRPFSLAHSYTAEHLATLDPAGVALARERGELTPGNRISGAAFLEACGAAFARDFPGFDPESDVHRARALMAVRARLLSGGYDSTYSVQAGHHTWAALHSDQVRRIDFPRREPRASAPEAPSKAREGETSESGRARAASREVASADVLDLTAFDVSPFGTSGAPQAAPAAIARGRTASGLVVDDAREALAGRRVVIVGDVHGELELLERALSRVDFRPEHGDVLVSVGDLIDRGPQSKEVLDYVQGLGGSFLAVRGNHEQRLLALHGREKEGLFLGDGLGPTLESFGAESGANAIPESYLDFLARMPHALRLPQGLVVHAGLSPDRSFEEQSPKTVLTIREVAAPDGSMVPWWRFGEPPVGERIFFGHTPLAPANAPECDRIVSLDGGATLGDQMRLWDSADGRLHSFEVADLHPERARVGARAQEVTSETHRADARPPIPSTATLEEARAVPSVAGLEESGPSSDGGTAARLPAGPEPPRLPVLPNLMTAASQVQAENPELFARFARETEYLARYGKSREAFLQNAEAILKGQKIEGTDRPTHDPDEAIGRALRELAQRSPAFGFDEALTRAWVHTGGRVSLEELDQLLHRNPEVIVSADGSRLTRVESYAEELYVAAQIARGRDVEPIVPASERPHDLEIRLRATVADPAQRAAIAAVLENRHQFSFVTSRDAGPGSAATDFAVGLHRELSRRGWHPVHVTTSFEQRGELLAAGVPKGQIASRHFFLDGGGWAFGHGQVAPVAIVHGAERLSTDELRSLVDRAHAGGLRVVFASRHPELAPVATRGPALLAAAAGERVIQASEPRYAGSVLAALWNRPTANDPGVQISAALSAALGGEASRAAVIEVDSSRRARAAEAALAAPGFAPALLVTNVSLDADRAEPVLSARTDVVRAELHRAGRLDLDEQRRVEVREKVPAPRPEAARAEHWRPGDWLYRREPGGAMAALRIVAVDQETQQLAVVASGQTVDGPATRAERMAPAEAAQAVTYRSAERSFAPGDIVRFRAEPGGPLESGRVAGFDRRGGVRIEGRPNDAPTPVFELDHDYVVHARHPEQLALARKRPIVLEIDGPRSSGPVQRLLAETLRERVEQILAKSERDLGAVLARPQNLGAQLALAVAHEARQDDVRREAPAAARKAPSARPPARESPWPPGATVEAKVAAHGADRGPGEPTTPTRAPDTPSPLTSALALPGSFEEARDEIIRLSSKIAEMQQIRRDLERSGKELEREQARIPGAKPETPEPAERFDERLGQLRAEGAGHDPREIEAARTAARAATGGSSSSALAAAHTARVLSTAQIALHAAERLLDDDPDRMTRNALATARSTSVSVTRSALGALAREHPGEGRAAILHDAPRTPRVASLSDAGGSKGALPRPAPGGGVPHAGSRSPVSSAAGAALSALNVTQTSRLVKGALERLSQGQAQEIVRLASLVAREGIQKAMTFVAPQVKPFVSAALAAGRTAAAAARALAAPSKGISR